MRTREEERELDRNYTQHKLTTARIELDKYVSELAGIKQLIKNKQQAITNLQENCDHDYYMSSGFKACRVCDKHIFKGIENER